MAPLVAVGVIAVGGAVACAPTPVAPPPNCTEPVCPLPIAATARDVRVGTAVKASLLASNPDYADAVRRHFTSVTPENDLKWSVLWPSPTSWNWEPADSIVAFAESNGMTVRGHTLAWVNESGSQNGLPQWLREVTDPGAFRTYVLDGVAQVVGRYRGRIDRWDVVNEVFDYSSERLAPSAYDRMGPDYIAEMFTAAHAADPDATLWLNEVFTELFPAKADAIVRLVASLRDRGIPIHGVGLQTHLTLTPAAPAPGSVSGLMSRLRDLGVDVAITELDVPLGPARGEQAQVDIYRQVVTECLLAGCSEVSTWGVSDSFTTLDSVAQRQNNPFLAAFFSLPSKPLLLDTNFEPKAAYQAVVRAMEQTPRVP
jgi:endo-1,4-beta-xylanase